MVTHTTFMSMAAWRDLVRKANADAQEAHRAVRRAKARALAKARRRRQSASQGS